MHVNITPKKLSELPQKIYSSAFFRNATNSILESCPNHDCFTKSQTGSTKNFIAKKISITEYSQKLETHLKTLKDKNNYLLFEDLNIKEIISPKDSFKKNILKLNLLKKLTQLKDKSGDSFFYSTTTIKNIVLSTKTPKLAECKLNMIKKLAKLETNTGNNIFFPHNIEYIILFIDTPEKALLQSDFAEKLVKLINKYDFNIKPTLIEQIIMSAKTQEEALTKYNLALKFASKKDSQENPTRTRQAIERLVFIANNEKEAQIIESLTEIKDNRGKPRFDIIINIKNIMQSAKTQEQVIAKFNIIKNLAELEDKYGKNYFNENELYRIALSVQNTEQASIIYDLIQKLRKLEDKFGFPKLTSTTIEKISTSTNTKEEAKLKFELTEKLAKLEDSTGEPRLEDDITEIVVSANTPEQAQLKFNLAKKLIKLENNIGTPSIEDSDISVIVASTNTKELAKLRFDLTEKLIATGDFKNNLKVNYNDAIEIILSADAPEKAQFVINSIENKDFTSKINSLNNIFGYKIFIESLKSHTAVDVEKINSLFNFLKENKISLQQQGEEKITDQSITELFNAEMLKTSCFIDETTIKYATKLKYENFKCFTQNVSDFTKDLNEETYLKLKKKLSELSTPQQKFERLQCLIALKKSDSDSSVINEAINLIKPAEVTEEQLKLVNKIFSSNKPYQEQIQEFFKNFSLSKNEQKEFKKFFEEHSQYFTLNNQSSIEYKLKIIDKKILDINNNIKIPESKKNIAIIQLQKNKEKLKTKLQNSTNSNSNNDKLNLIIKQIEKHINTQNNNEFNKFINSQIFKNLDFKLEPEILEKLIFDQQYLSRLLFATSNVDFIEQFSKLIKLINKNPTMPLSESREALEHNQQTKKLFTQNGINYQKWIKFDENLALPFSCETNLEEAIKGVELNIINELNGELFKSVDKIQTNKILQALSNAGYKINLESITKNNKAITKNDLKKIIAIFKDTINKNSDFWDKPLANAKAENLKNELLDHLLKGRKKEVADLTTMTNAKMDLNIRLTNDDNINRNLFLGNHVGCCTSVEGVNGFAAPQHLMNSFVRAIEIVDNEGDSYGNSMCYFAKVDNKLSFIIDSFEANGKLGGNQIITDAIISYAKTITKEMGKPDIPVFFGPNYNKINMSKLEKTSNHTVEIIGNVEYETYIDAIGGNEDVNIPHFTRGLYKVK